MGSNLLYADETYSIVGSCMEVHKELGSGFLEAVYQEALEIEFSERGIAFEREKELFINFKGKKLIVKELKHGDDFKDIDIALTSAGAGISKEYASTITKHG